MQKKLYRSKTDAKIAGVCGGLAEYLNIDPTVIRVIWAIASIFAFVGVVAYVAWGAVVSGPEAALSPQAASSRPQRNIIRISFFMIRPSL